MYYDRKNIIHDYKLYIVCARTPSTFRFATETEGLQFYAYLSIENVGARAIGISRLDFRLHILRPELGLDHNLNFSTFHHMYGNIIIIESNKIVSVCL
jgi:hypothetical protein